MSENRLIRLAIIVSLVLSAAVSALGQTSKNDDQFGPVVRAYLGYLRNEQEVVDDRASRHEVNVAYYRRNSNRIRALRQIAIQIARDTQNDYLPELEAVAGDELGVLFDHPPRFQNLRVGEVVQTTFRYLGTVRSGDTFYVFARLDPYEQADLLQKVSLPESASGSVVSNPANGAHATSRARRVTVP
ncbi:MAG TPA: hypothetical protein VIW64_08200 [Pyrinomonadaceae bacterium]|jgi:hypothetical protein